MDLTENLNLIGYSMTENRQLKNIEEVADFICKQGKHGDVTITNNGEPFITTIFSKDGTPSLTLTNAYPESVNGCITIAGDISVLIGFIAKNIFATSFTPSKFVCFISHIHRVLQEKAEAEFSAKIMRTDKKLRRRIAEKKQAQGLKLE